MSKLSALRPLVLALVALASLPAVAARDDSEVIFVNQSNWAIHELYFSPTDEADWGPDQLGRRTIETGGRFTLTGVECGTWDVRVVDEDGDVCIIRSVALCGDTDRWVIKDRDLLACQNTTEED